MTQKERIIQAEQDVEEAVNHIEAHHPEKLCDCLLLLSQLTAVMKETSPKVIAACRFPIEQLLNRADQIVAEKSE